MDEWTDLSTDFMYVPSAISHQPRQPASHQPSAIRLSAIIISPLFSLATRKTAALSVTLNKALRIFVHYVSLTLRIAQ